MKENIPLVMTAAGVDPLSGKLITRQVPVPVLKKGEVLVKISMAPINPSDLARISEIGKDEAKDFIPGVEGCGTVVASGGGLLPALFMGKRVACSSKHKSSGTWAEYMVAPAGSCFPIGNKIAQEQASMAIVNPMTALAFLDIARKRQA